MPTIIFLFGWRFFFMPTKVMNRFIFTVRKRRKRQNIG